jgi:hypothetical protein
VSDSIDSTYSILVYPSKLLPTMYISLIFSRWLRSLRYGNPLFRKMRSKEYFDHYHIYIENLLSKPDSEIRLAVLSDDHDNVLGFSVVREDVLDYIHVHDNNRNVGIGKSLLPKNVTTFTHITGPAIQIWQKTGSKYKELKFNPFA